MEQVYVLPAERFPSPSGKLLELSQALWLELGHTGHFIPRPQAEEDPSFRQIIPYCVVRHGERFLLMRRTKKGGEARLHDLYTLGVGGHINPVDFENGGDQGFVILNAMKRELHEEIHISNYEARPVGLIVLEDSAVSKVHAGIVFSVVAEEAPSVLETHKLEGHLATLDEIKAVYDGLESWSQLVFHWLKAPLPKEKGLG